MRVAREKGELVVIGDLDLIMHSDNPFSPQKNQYGCGRELFAMKRENIGNAEQGASYLFAEVQ